MSRIKDDNLLIYQIKINQWVEEHKDEILDFNCSLVSIPSENLCPNGNEKDAQNFMATVLKQLNCDVDMFSPAEVPGINDHPAYLKGRNYQSRPNVVGVKKGAGKGKSIIFSGHMDTVPLGKAPWTVDPFSGIVKDGKQYGLGLFDMKGGLAASVMALKAVSDIGIELNGDVMIESVVDEEYGGANGTLACRLRGYNADIAIITEPTNMVICPVNQGGGMYRITFKGRSGQGFSGERLINPTYAAGRFLEIFQEYEKVRGEKVSTSEFYSGVIGTPAQVIGIKSEQAERNYSDRIPSECSIDVWIQCFPDVSEEELFRDFSNFVQNKAAHDPILVKIPPKIEKINRFLPGTSIPEDHEIITVVQEATNAFHQTLPVKGAPFACDSFMFNLYSPTPALILGPAGGNAHAPNEFIYVDDFMFLVKLFALTIVKWCGVNKS